MSCKNYLILVLFFNILGCSTTEEFIDDITAPDYVNSSKAKKLEIPPDLSEIETNASYNVPGEAKSYRDFLERENQLASDSKINKQKVIQNPEGMRIVKSGNLRWLIVQKEPDFIWPHVKDFWEDLGFRVLISNKRTGIMETEWMDTEDIKLDQNKGALSTFDKWLDSLSGFADKRKFRTRVEVGEDGSTEIYISQRSAEAASDQHSRIMGERGADYNPSTIYKIDEYKSDDSSKGKKKIEITQQREADDYEIDSELLTRLMIKLGAADLDARKKVDNPVIITKTKLVQSKDDSYIIMYDGFDRAWRRLGLALDIIGFVTEDKNRSEGIYFVRFGEIDLPEEKKEEEKGIIDSLIFWGDKEDSSTLEDSSNDEEKAAIEEKIAPNEPKYTGIEAPEVKPIDEDYYPEEFSEENDWQYSQEETWLTKIWPSWGDENQDKVLPENEKRYRVRIKPSENRTSIVYLDFSNGKRNLSKDALKVLTILNEYLK